MTVYTKDSTIYLNKLPVCGKVLHLNHQACTAYIKTQTKKKRK